MSFLPISYYGAPGLESDVFVSYMRCAGFPTQLTALQCLDSRVEPPQANGVVIISVDWPPDEINRLIGELRQKGNGSTGWIFVLTFEENFVPDCPGVQVVERPFHLSEVARRIHALNRS